MTRLGFAVNLDACSDHRSCMIACKREKNAFTGAYPIETFTAMGGDVDAPNTYFVPIMCQHCGNPACVAACAAGVIVKRDDGLVVLGDQGACASCADVPCVEACPYGRISFDAVTHTILKCDGCADLVDAGGMPACIPNCWMSTLVFGDFDDPTSMVSQMVDHYGDYAHQLNPDAGTDPTCRYLLSTRQWCDMDGLYSPAWHETSNA